MTTLSGLVAVLNDAGTQVLDIRDLGPTPVGVKANVRPAKAVKPTLAAGQYYGAPTYAIEPDVVTVTYSVVDPPTNAQIADESIVNDIAFRALVKTLAARFGVTVSAFKTEIKSNA